MDSYIVSRWGTTTTPIVRRNVVRVIIYILELTSCKYYVGKCSDLDKRIKEHREGKGSLWTKKYPMVKVMKYFITDDVYDEDKTVKSMMAIYGIDNVRGGSYCSVWLGKDEKKFIQREIWNAQNLCSQCGSPDHWVKECKLFC